METKAIRIREYGGPEVMRLETVDLPEAGRGEVLVRIHAIGVNYIDTYFRTGAYKAPSLPFIPGKTIVMTGALSPARFRGSDAEFNIGCAIGAVQCLPAGVYIAMNGRIWDPAKVRKNVAANRFEAI